MALADYTGLNRCTGAEFRLGGEEELDLRYVVLSRKGNQLDIEAKGEKKGSAKEVTGALPGKELSVTLTGKGILFKTSAEAEYAPENQLETLFPGMKPADFYVQRHYENGIAYYSLARKTTVDQLLEQLERAGKRVLIISFGPFAVSHILGQLNHYSGALTFDGHRFSLHPQGGLESYAFQPGAASAYPLKLGIQPVDERLVLAYAAAFQLVLYDKLEPVRADVEEVNHALEETGYEKRFNRKLAILLAAVFVLLLINFAVWSTYTAKNESLQASASRARINADSLDIIRRQGAGQEALLKELAWNGGMPYAYIADQLGQSVPARVRLSEMELNKRVQENSPQGQRERYIPGTIRITGNTSSLQDLNDWIVLLRMKPWIRSVSLSRYDQAAQAGEQPSFEILLKY